MVPTIGLNLRVTGHCNQGGRRYMEDAFVVAYQQSGDGKDLEYAYFGMFDGHGGREAAIFAKENLMNNIASQKCFWSEDDDQVLKAIRDGFIATHYAMWKEVGNWPKTVSGQPSTSGTTSSIAFIRRQKLYIGHVGDSKIVLGYQEHGESEWSAMGLTTDHKPESPEERERIRNVGGLVMNKAGVERVVWKRPRPGHKGPVRRSTLIDQIPFLAVARSLGDLWSYNHVHDTFVVSPEPEVRAIPLDPFKHRCIIFASDGLWNMITLKGAVTIVQTADEENEKIILEGVKGVTDKQPRNPSKILVDAALRHWSRLNMRADNTSVVTVMLDPPGPPKSEVLLRQKIMRRLRPRDEQSEEGVENKATPEVEDKEKKQLKELTVWEAERKRRFSEVCTKPRAPSIEPNLKERKVTSEPEDPIPRNLPKPVILSPQRIVFKRPAVEKTCPCHKPVESNTPADGVENSAAQANMMACTKKTVPPDKKEEVSSSSDEGTEKKMDCGEKTEPETNQDVLPPAQNKAPPREVPVKEHENENMRASESQPSVEINENESVKTKGDSPPSNGRVHLCEVDNVLNERTSDSRVLRERVRVPKRNPVTVKIFRKASLRRTSEFSKAKKLNQVKLLKGKSSRRTFVHNTRAQSGIRKLKV